MIFADLAVLVGPRRIEIPQCRPDESMGASEIREHAFHHQFGSSVGVDGFLRSVFADRKLIGNPISCACTREHDPGDAVITHGLQQGEAADHVVAVILSGVRYRLADIGEGRKVHHRFWSVSRKYLV